MRGDVCDFRFLDWHHGMAATICAGSAIHLPLNVTGQDLKCPLVNVMRREVASKCEVFFRLRGSEPKNFRQVGNHVLKILLLSPGRQASRGRTKPVSVSDGTCPLTPLISHV